MWLPRQLWSVFLLFPVQSCFGEAGSCFFSYTLTDKKTSQVFGHSLTNAETPCLVWFKTEETGFFRLDINNKIFASKREKKSCLSEYVIVESDNFYTKLCHSNITAPVEIKDFSGELTVLIKWVGELDPSTSYLGQYNFDDEYKTKGVGEDDYSIKLSESISTKLKTYMQQKDQEDRIPDIQNFKYKTSSDCREEQGVLCKYSRFCAQPGVDTSCNTSLYLCLPSRVACDGNFDCLDGDLSDEVGCYLPYVLFSTGGVVLTLTLLASVSCLVQHHKVMTRNDMVRFNNDLVRRKDKVKARKADLYSNKKPGNSRQSGSISRSKPGSLNGNNTEKSSSKASLLNNSADLGRHSVEPTPAKLPPAPMKRPVAAATAATAATTATPKTNTFEMKEAAGQNHCVPKPKTDIPGAANAASATENQGNPLATEQKIHSPPMAGQQNSVIQPIRYENNISQPMKVENGSQCSTPSTPLHVTSQPDERQRTLSRKDKKILADEKDMLREIRKESFGFENQFSGNELLTEPFVTQSQLDRLEEVGITPIRRPIIRNSSSGSIVDPSLLSNMDDGNRSGYGYRFDFRDSSEFEFTEDAYI